MTTAPHIRPVPADLPVYPIGAQDRLDGNSFVKWNSARWMASRTAKLMAWDQQGMHRYLFDACQMETPVGTLPDDDRELAAMLRPDGSVGAMPGAGVTLWAAGDRAVKALYRAASLGTVWRCVAGRRLEGAA